MRLYVQAKNKVNLHLIAVDPCCWLSFTSIRNKMSAGNHSRCRDKIGAMALLNVLNYFTPRST